MSNYYYLSASLPLLLFFHGEPVIHYNDFLDDCQRLLSKKDYIQIHNASLNAEYVFDEGSETLQKWQKINITIHNHLVKKRAKRLGISPEPYLHTEYNEIPVSEYLEVILEGGSPLTNEIHIMEFQWKILDELESEHLFDLDFLIVYSLKLQIIERKISFNRDIGQVRLQTILKQEYDQL